MTDLNKERKDFIEAMKKNGCPMWMFERDEDGNFEDMTMAHSWYAWQEKAKAQVVPEGYKLVPVELSENIAERLAFERVPKPRPENDPVWVEIAERAYKSNLLAKKWELVREYKILTEASESGAEG